MHVLLCVCSSRTRCSVLPPLEWRRLWPVEVASVSCLPCSCPFTYRSSRPPVWVPSHDADTLNNMALHVAVSGHGFARPQTLSGLPLTVCLVFVSDQSAELQAQISNLFKSLAVQLQGTFFFSFLNVYAHLSTFLRGIK